MPTALSPSLACVEIHCESKLDCTRYPVNAVPIEPRNATAPVTQVSARAPRQAAMKNLPHRWITMTKKNSSTLHRCRQVLHGGLARQARADLGDRRGRVPR